MIDLLSPDVSHDRPIHLNPRPNTVAPVGWPSLRRHGGRVVVSLLLLMLFNAARSCAPVRPPEQPVGESLRVMTYNLYKDSTDLDAAIEVIRQTKPDVICFQELSDEWQARLLRDLGETYPHHSFNQPQKGYDGIGLMSRYPIVEVGWPTTPDGGWFPSLWAALETPLGRVQILNVHLRPPMSGGSNAVGYFATPPVRRREIAGLLAQLPSREQTLIIGDFNEGDYGGAVQILQDQSFTDALPEFDRKTSTWQGSYMGIGLSDRPDHILYSPDLRCFQARAIPETASDHDPVIAVIASKDSQ